MTTMQIEDYLTKQLFVSKNIVTYRSLSREFGIHVNVAKNALAAFHTKSSKSPEQTCSATYLISGEVTTPPVKADDEDMDVDYGFTPTPKPNYGFAGSGDGQSDGEVVVQIQMTVVGEDGLEGAKAKYVKVTSIHVYSLSPSPIRDADLLCAPTRGIREVDNQKGLEVAMAVGKIIGAGIKMKEGGIKVKGRTASVTSAQLAAPKLKTGPSIAGPSVTTTRVEGKGKESLQEEPRKTKQTGKLNFFAPKEQPSKNSAEAKGKTFFGGGKSAAPSTKHNTPVLPRPPKEKAQDTEPVKRGLKRKSTAAVLSEEGEEEEEEETNLDTVVPSGPSSRRSSKPPSTRPSPQSATAMSKLRLHKGAILSDDEGGEQPRKKILKKPRRKASVISDTEGRYDVEAARESANALKSMMEIDDDQVEKASRKAKVEMLRQEEEEETEPEKEVPPAQTRDGDVDMSDDTETKRKPKPRKKKEKKTVPVGRNGLKKRRIMKSRMRVDEKGYMVTEDYSSYESVDEEEEEEVKKLAPTKKGNGGKRPSASKEEPTDKDVEVPAPEDANINAPTPSGDTKLKPMLKAASSSTKSATARTGAAAKGGQKQKTLNTFFGVPKAKK